MEEKHYKTVRDALKYVAADAMKVSDVFNEWGIDPTTVASKTGTGEVAGKGDTAWFVCYYPQDKPKYVVSTVIEQGGGGAEAAGPVGANVLSAILAYDKGELKEIKRVAGSSGKSVALSSGSTARTD